MDKNGDKHRNDSEQDRVDGRVLDDVQRFSVTAFCPECAKDGPKDCPCQYDHDFKPQLGPFAGYSDATSRILARTARSEPNPYRAQPKLSSLTASAST